MVTTEMNTSERKLITSSFASLSLGGALICKSNVSLIEVNPLFRALGLINKDNLKIDGFTITIAVLI